MATAFTYLTTFEIGTAPSYKSYPLWIHGVGQVQSKDMSQIQAISEEDMAKAVAHMMAAAIDQSTKVTYTHGIAAGSVHVQWALRHNILKALKSGAICSNATLNKHYAYGAGKHMKLRWAILQILNHIIFYSDHPKNWGFYNKAFYNSNYNYWMNWKRMVLGLIAKELKESYGVW